MANKDQLKILRRGVEAWNEWRAEHPEERIDLSEADLPGAKLELVNLSRVDLSRANLRGSKLIKANLIRVNLSEANLRASDLSGADLRGANLAGANLTWTHLSEADLRAANIHRAKLIKANLGDADLSLAELIGADLNGAYLVGAALVETNLEEANIVDCAIYGISAWGLKLKNATQRNLAITPYPTSHPGYAITVDDLEVAQFIYLLLRNEKIRHVIDTISSKVVLILGRFTSERKAVLNEIKIELRKRDYLPVIFDFGKPSNRDLTETISTLAHIARFIIADITDPRAVPVELVNIVPRLPSVPVMPLLFGSDREYTMFESIKRFPWVLEPYRYDNQAQLIESIGEKVIAPAEIKVRECRPH